MKRIQRACATVRGIYIAFVFATITFKSLAFTVSDYGLVIVSDENFSINISGEVTFYVDETGLDFSEVRGKSFFNHVDPSVYERKDVSIWSKITIRNLSPNEHFILTLDQWDQATLHYERDGEWTKELNGNEVTPTQRPLLRHRYLNFELSIPSATERTIYVETKNVNDVTRYCAGTYSFLKKVEIGSVNEVLRKYLRNQQIVSFTLGLTLILAFYSLLLFVVDAQRTSLVLFVYLILVSFEVAVNFGASPFSLPVFWHGNELQVLLHLAHFLPISIAVYLMAFFRFGVRDWQLFALSTFIVLVSVCWLLALLNSKAYLFEERRVAEMIVFSGVTFWSTIERKRWGNFWLFIAVMSATFFKYYAELESRNSDGTIHSFTQPEVPYLIALLITVVLFSMAGLSRVRTMWMNLQKALKREKELVMGQNRLLQIEVENKTVELVDRNNRLKENLDELQTQSIAIKDLNLRLEVLLSDKMHALRNVSSDFNTFLYRAAHDLRRPLTSIRGVSGLMKRETDHRAVTGLIPLIDHCVDDLDSMLKKMIVISYCNDDVSPELSKIVLYEFITDVIHNVTGLLGVDERNFRMIQLPNTEFSIESNAYIIGEVLRALLENAVHFGGKDVQVFIEVWMDMDQVVIQVKDDGPGISEEYHEKIFDIFFRGSENAKGNGLGLYLAKMGMRKLRGSIKLNSSNKYGSEFLLRLPVTANINQKTDTENLIGIHKDI
jgi:signal transduction histidine kinase